MLHIPAPSSGDSDDDDDDDDHEVDTAIGDTKEDAIGVVIEEALLVPNTAAMLQGWNILKCVSNVFETLKCF